MADEEKEKAEKLAAAKKRFEQLKKEQQKKGKKTAVKRKDEKPAEAKPEDATRETAPVEEPAQGANTAEDDEGPAAIEAASKPEVDLDNDGPEKLQPVRQPSVSMQSKQRSVSFRQGAASVLSPVATDLNAGTGPISPSMEVQDLYRKQAARIEELERENRAIREQQEASAERLGKADEELEGLREDSGQLAEVRSKAKEADRLNTELASLQRQLAHAQHAVKGSTRRVSGTSSDLSEQLASKTASIESLELELSNVRNQLLGLQTAVSERDASIKDGEERARAGETAAEAYKQELDALKVSMSFGPDDTKSEDPETLHKRITVLESDLRTANANLDAAAQRAASLEQKIEALTKLHRDATTTSVLKDKELSDLRNQLKKRDRPSHVRDASEFELGEEETETGALHARIRALEADNFDLRRGVWRERRAEIQPGMEDHREGGQAPEYEDVDLDGPYSPRLRDRLSSPPRQSSSLQDVITSGISAFTGRLREPLPARGGHHADSPARGRKQSLGLLSDDGGFDEDAFRLAQEEEGRRRIERVKEVKRELDAWRGWRVDIAEMRQHGMVGGRDCGPVFEV